MSARILAVALASMAALAARADVPADDLLASLASEVQRSRAAPPSEQGGPNGPTPELGFLVGLPADQLRGALGKPDACSSREDGRCMGTGEWQYQLDPSPPGWRGGGGRILVLEFGADPTCTSARWQFTR